MTINSQTAFLALIALCWPIFSVLPDPRFGGGLMLNAIVYAIILILALLLFPRQKTSELAILAIFLGVLIHMPTLLRTIVIQVPDGDFKAFDIIATHFVFLMAGMAAGRQFERYAPYFFLLLLLICLSNLAIELYPDWIIVDRRKVGFLGGQGFSRMLALATLGLILFARPGSWLTRKWFAVALLGFSVTLSLYSGSRGAIISLMAALFVARHAQHMGKVLFGALVLGGLLVLAQIALKDFYLDEIRPIMITADLPEGIRRTVLTLDLFFISDVGQAGVLSAVERFDLWAEALRMTAEYPLGVGYGGFKVHYLFQNADFPHNVVLEMLAEAGILVGGVYIAVIISVIRLTSHKMMPILALLIVFLQFSGDLVDLRQLMFFLGIVLTQFMLTRKATEQGAILATERAM